MSTRPYPSPVSLSNSHTVSSAHDDSRLSVSIHSVKDTELVAWSNSGGKRVFDLAVCIPLTLACLPLLVALAVLVKLSSRGPALFLQVRMGKGGVPFTIYKFRTMRMCDHNANSVTRRGDARLTRIGKLLRKLKLDELPQLYNVLLGDMSLVGPRPKIVGHDKYTLPCRPGITGKATLLFKDEEDLLAHLPHEEVVPFAVEVLNPIKAQLDCEYALNGSFESDFAILVSTALRMRHKGAITSFDHLAERFPEAFAQGDSECCRMLETTIKLAS